VITWPDILIVAIVLIAALKGFKRGFVMELAGAIALTCALITPWLYNGAFDPVLENAIHLGPGSAHVVAMFLTGIFTYGVILLLARVLNAVAKLPVLGIGNSIAGGAVGVVKAAVGLWLLLFVVLFFPLSPDLRADLHRSTLVSVLTRPNDGIDRAISGTLPWFARAFARPYFSRHRV
jgi:membrane protein required for colicin V production